MVKNDKATIGTLAPKARNFSNWKCLKCGQPFIPNPGKVKGSLKKKDIWTGVVLTPQG